MTFAMGGVPHAGPQHWGPWQGGDNVLASAATVPEVIVVSRRGVSAKG